MSGFYTEEPLSLEAIACGTSHLMYALSPMTLYETYGIKTYNLSTSRQPIQVTYYLLKESLKSQAPKIFIYDVSGLYLAYTGESAWHYIFDCIPLSQNKYEAAVAFSDIYEDESPIYAISSLWNYHNRWDSLIKHDFDLLHNNRFYSKGQFISPEQASSTSVEEMNQITEILASMNERKVSAYIAGDYKETIQNEPLYNVSIPAQSIEWLLKIQTLCHENNIKLLLVKMPSIHYPNIYSSAWTSYRSNEVKKTCEAYGIEFFDILYDSNIEIDPTRDFVDGGMHLNFIGAQKATAILGDYLNTHYQLATASDAQWDQDLDMYNDIRNIALLEMETDFSGYLTAPKEHYGDKVIFISVDNNIADNLTDNDKDLLCSIGLKTDFSDTYRKAFMAVVENGIVTYEALSNRRLSYKGKINSSETDYLLKSSGYYTSPSTEIIINGKDYAVHHRGFNIVVYDAEKDLVLDSVSFDTTYKEHPATRNNASVLQYLREYEYYLIENYK